MGQSRFKYMEFHCTPDTRLDILNSHGSGGWDYCSEYVNVEAEMAEDSDEIVVLMKLEIKSP